VLRQIFGRYLVLPLPFTVLFRADFPNLLEPNWMIEGLAVYSESDWNKHNGRLGQSHFEGMMRAESARGLRSLAEVNAEGRGFPLNRDYLYGSYFFLFLAEALRPGLDPQVCRDLQRTLVSIPGAQHPRGSLPARRWTSCGSNTTTG